MDIEKLKELLRETKKIYVCIRKISRSNLTWYFNSFIIFNNELFLIDYFLEKLGLYKQVYLQDFGYCLKGSGVGTNRAFEVAYRLSQELFNDGYFLEGKFI